MLGRKGGDAGELHMLFAGAQSVADGEDARVKQADNVACVGLADDGAIVGHQTGAGGELDIFALLYVESLHAALKFAGADAQKRDAVAVVFVHVGLNFEHKAAKLFTARVDQLAGHAVLAGQRGGGQAQELLQKRLHAKVGQCRAEEHGAQLAVLHSASLAWLAAPIRSSRRGSPNSASISSTIFTPLARPSLSNASTRRAVRSYTPLKSLPQLMGQFIG